MASNPMVSVLLPVWNAEDTLRDAVSSILRQNYASFNLIVIDDGSTDGTGAVLERLRETAPRLVTVRHPRNRGIVAALESGLSVSSGKYIARMDADDVSLPDRLRLQAAYLDRHAQVGVVSSLVEFGGDDSRHAGYAGYVDWINSLVTPEQIALNRFVESPIAHPSVMFRRELIERHGGYRDGSFPEDYDLWLRWLEAGVVMAKIPEVLVRWHDPPRRLSRTDPRYSVEAFYRCKAGALCRWLRKNNPRHPEIILWGAGRQTRKRARALTSAGVRITHFVDIDPRRIGQVIHGRPVLAEGELPAPDQAFVVSYVGSRGARDDIRARLIRRGFREGHQFIMGA